jgi:hypothetical protein
MFILTYVNFDHPVYIFMRTESLLSSLATINLRKGFSIVENAINELIHLLQVLIAFLEVGITFFNYVNEFRH